jgi:hypothetical protein
MEKGYLSLPATPDSSRSGFFQLSIASGCSRSATLKTGPTVTYRQLRLDRIGDCPFQQLHLSRPAPIRTYPRLSAVIRAYSRYEIISGNLDLL